MLDNIQRSPQQFFKQYRQKILKRGALKLLRMCLDLVVIYYFTTEHKLKKINEFFRKICTHKIIEIHGMEIEVSSAVSCLSNEDYNKNMEPI